MTTGGERFHAVQFYSDSESLATLVSQFIGEGFAATFPAIVIATPDHRDIIVRHLDNRGFDVQRLEASHQLLMRDSEEVLSRFIVDGVPDRQRFRAVMAPLIEMVGKGRPGCVIRAYGEMVDVLWKAGQAAAAIRLETLWNELAQTHEFALLCGYSMGSFYKDAPQGDICRQHTHVLSDSGEAIRIQ
jgi:hypothetical protein